MQRFRPNPLVPATLTLALGALTTPAAAQDDRPAPPQRAPWTEVVADCVVEKPKELFDVVRVVDGDTIWIQRGDEVEKLRLLSIDTEEKWVGGNDISPTKPSTRFGEQATGWAQGFFMPRTPDEGAPRVGLRFPGGLEQRDPYGRLLCHVVTREGVDFNLLMVRTGLSPYFNKYGNSRIDHERFVALQRTARAERIGIWDERTNEGGKSRPYAKLLPWWNARAQAVDAFRAKAERDPLAHVAADEPDALERAIADGPREVTVLALVDRFFEEDDGSRTVLLRGGDRRRSVRVRIPKELRSAMERHGLDGANEDFRQNYLLVRGTLQRGARGFDLAGVGVEDWERAGPEPESEAESEARSGDGARRR